MKTLILFIFSTILLYGVQPSFLMPDEAFNPAVKMNSKNQIEATIELGKDIYLYAEQVKIELEKSDFKISKITYPESVEHDGDKVYLSSPIFLIDLVNQNSSNPVSSIKLNLSYQGCSEQGLCYEPFTKSFTLEIDSSNFSSQVFEEAKDVEVSETDSIADTIKSGNVLLILFTFFGFGLLLSLTPCVFPMIPIISGVIISQGKGLTTRKAFVLSIVYVLAMAVAYTIAGVLAGLFGSNLQAALQTPWVIYSFAGVFVGLALSMFGLYELKVPDFIVAKVSENSHHSGYAGVAIMGFLSALIVGPCVAAPLAGALVYIGQTGDALLGGSALFVMSLGMGLPLIAVGVSAGRFMPRPGEWMTMVSAVFGVMMLGVAIWMLERVVDDYIIMILYAMLGMGFSVYLGTFENTKSIFRKIFGVIIFIYSLVLFIGALGGSTSMSKPLDFLQPSCPISSTSVVSEHLTFEVVQSISELDAVLQNSSGKKIILDFTAKWCAVCKELDEITFSDKRVKAKMKEFILIQADLTENSKEQKELSKKYGVFGPPVIMFFDKNIEVIKSKTIVGFIEPDEFLSHLNQI
ncbi:protein-disulfide reductase DsbD [Sulfurimonas sp.]|nr:protein-disulfide reductase DsbD [Sulfurimonas sp.]